MMRQMRQNTKIILWIVVVAFVVTIFAVWGMDLRTGSSGQDPGVLGRVNGVPITRAQYQAAYEQLAAQFRAASPGTDLTYSQQELVRRQAWENIVISILADQQIEEFGIGVTDDEIISFLINTPPLEIRHYFTDETGKFDYQAYRAALNNPNADWTSLENLARQRIPQLKLDQYLSARVHVSNEEVRRAYEEEKTELTVRYVEFPFDSEDLGDYAPSDQEIEAYYKENLSRYTEGEKAAIEVVKIEIQPSQADVEDILYSLDVIREQILSGEDFAVLAKTYSEAHTADEGGDTGWIGEGYREPEVIQMLDSLGDGELSEAVKAERGYYLIKRLEKRTGEGGSPEYRAQEIYMGLSPGSATVDSVFVLATELREKALTVGLQAAAGERNLRLQTPEPFYRNSPIEELGFVPALNEFAFSNKVGTLSGVIRDEGALYICRVTERTEEAAKPISDVREAIVGHLLLERKKQASRRRADGFYDKTRTTDLSAAADAYELEKHEIGPFRVVDNLDNFGSRSSFALAALSLEGRSVSPPIECNEAYYVIELLERSAIDEEDFQKSSPSLGNRLYGEKLRQYMSYWYENLKKRSKIEDYRDMWQ